MGNTHRDFIFELKNGRKISYSVLGDVNGKPVLFFHGWPGTRLDISCHDLTAKKLGVKIIAIDRPGSGKSDYYNKRSIDDWPQDISELVTKLKINSFSLLGFSTGGLYAFECLEKMNDKITNVGLVSAVPYYYVNYPDKTSSRLINFAQIISHNKILLKLISRIISGYGLRAYKRNPQKEYQKSLKELPTIDRDTWTQEFIRKWFFDQFIPDLLYSPTKGIAQDFELLVNALISPHKDIHQNNSSNKIFFWHGDSDNIVPIICSIEQKKILPNSELFIYPNEGHKILYTHFSEILTKLIE